MPTLRYYKDVLSQGLVYLPDGRLSKSFSSSVKGSNQTQLRKLRKLKPEIAQPAKNTNIVDTNLVEGFGKPYPIWQG